MPPDPPRLASFGMSFTTFTFALMPLACVELPGETITPITDVISLHLRGVISKIVSVELLM